LETGKLQKLEKIRADDSNAAIGLLTRVANVGPVKAKELVDSGITSIEGVLFSIINIFLFLAVCSELKNNNYPFTADQFNTLNVN